MLDLLPPVYLVALGLGVAAVFVVLFYSEHSDLFYFSTKKKTANQPITAAVPVNLVYKKGCDWLIDGFLFGTEIGVGHLKNHPVKELNLMIESKK